MPVQQQGIISLRSGQTNLYLLKAAEGLVLVDAGTRGSFKRLERGLHRRSLSPDDISLVVVTHTHCDHVGGLGEIVARTGAKVLVHESEADFLATGFTPFPRGTGRISRIISWLGRSLLVKIAGYAPVAPDIVIDGSLDLGPYGCNGRIEPTPGHSAGSISLIVESESALVGDTLFHHLPWRIYPPFADDEAALIRSWQKLLDTGCQTFYPAHGRPVPRELFVRKAAGILWRG